MIAIKSDETVFSSQTSIKKAIKVEPLKVPQIQFQFLPQRREERLLRIYFAPRLNRDGRINNDDDRFGIYLSSKDKNNLEHLRPFKKELEESRKAMGESLTIDWQKKPNPQNDY